MTARIHRYTIPVVFGYFIAVLFALSACQKGNWGGEQVQESGFVDLVAQLKLATARCGDDLEKANEARRVLLKQHAVTPETYHQHLAFLTDHPSEWKSFQEKLVERLKFYQQKAKGDLNGQ